jgi:hypothetical protein
VRLSAPVLTQGQTGTITADLESLGNENALAFSLSFDATKLVFIGAAPADAAAGATLNVNAKQAAQGQLGFALALSANQSFAVGSNHLVQMNFRALPSAGGNASVAFTDQPVPRGVSDPNASVLGADYVNATVAISPAPALKIVAATGNFDLSWPTAPDGFVLQESTDATLAPTSWTSVSSASVVANGQNVVSVPSSTTNKFYRLYHP